MKPQTIKDDQDIFFDFEELRKIHSYEMGYQIKENPIPQIPIEPITFTLQSIMESSKDNSALKKELEKFSDYLYNNGFENENLEEFEELQFGQFLIELCNAFNPEISQNAFHIITLLQSKGPAFPAIFFSEEFLDFCAEKIQKHKSSAVCYYAFVAATNISSQSQQLFEEVFRRIPLDSINPQNFVDSNIKEAALDLACTFVKYQIDFQIASQVIQYAKDALATTETYFHHSAFWIFVRLLRFAPEDLTEQIMVPEIINHANDVFENTDSYSLIPGLIFISYIYELNFDISDFSYNDIINILAETEDPLCRKQALRTISKMCYRNNSLISNFIRYGLIYAFSSAVEKGQYKDKVEVGFTACNILGEDLADTTNRILASKSITLFLTFIDLDDEELNKRALICMFNVFDEANKIGRVDELKETFLANDGQITIEKLQHEEDNETAECAANFEHQFLSSVEEEDQQDGEFFGDM